MNDRDRTIPWIRAVLNALQEIDEKKGIELLHACGRACSKGSALLEGAERIRKERGERGDVDSLFEVFKSEYCDTPRLVKEGNVITLVFESCTCPMVREGVRDAYLCHCTVGYTKNLFETLLGRPVRVNLLESILGGDRVCRQEIRVEGGWS